MLNVLSEHYTVFYIWFFTFLYLNHLDLCSNVFMCLSTVYYFLLRFTKHSRVINSFHIFLLKLSSEKCFRIENKVLQCQLFPIMRSPKACIIHILCCLVSRLLVYVCVPCQRGVSHEVFWHEVSLPPVLAKGQCAVFCVLLWECLFLPLEVTSLSTHIWNICCQL